MEQVDYCIHLTPSETHFYPIIEFRHEEDVVNILSVHYFNLHYAASVELAVYQKHSPSVPITQPAYTLYEEQVDSGIQPVPDVVH